MNKREANTILGSHNPTICPETIEHAYMVLFNTDMKTRLLQLTADYKEPARVNTEFDHYGWNVTTLIRHLYGSAL